MSNTFQNLLTSDTHSFTTPETDHPVRIIQLTAKAFTGQTAPYKAFLQQIESYIGSFFEATYS